MWSSTSSGEDVAPDGSISEPMSARELETRVPEITTTKDSNVELRTKRVVVTKHGDTSIFFERHSSNAIPIQSQRTEFGGENVPPLDKHLVKSFRGHKNNGNSPPKFRRRTATTSVSALRSRAEERLSRLERLQVMIFEKKVPYPRLITPRATIHLLAR